jgi:hypothetical protein
MIQISTCLYITSAIQVKQRGQITRIASGCTPVKQAELQLLYKKLFPQYHVHFTPDFKTDGKSKKSYDFYNKPYGMVGKLGSSYAILLSTPASKYIIMSLNRYRHVSINGDIVVINCRSFCLWLLALFVSIMSL